MGTTWTGQSRGHGMKTGSELGQKADWQVHAYCLMGNHCHLVVETPRGNLVEGMRWLQSAYTIPLKAKAERLVAEEPEKLGWVEDNLARRRKSGAGKLAIAARLRREATLTLKAIAVRLSLGSPKSANARLREWRAAQAGEPKAASPRRLRRGRGSVERNALA